MKLLAMLLLMFTFSFVGCASKKCCKEKCDDKKECCMKDKKCEGATCDKKQEAKKCCKADCQGKCDPSQAGSCKKCEEGKCDGETCDIKKADAPTDAAPVAAPAATKKKTK